MSSDVAARLLAWLQRHPLKQPPSTKQAAYTDEVMARVRASAPAPVLQWVLRPTAVVPSPLPRPDALASGIPRPPRWWSLQECRSRLVLRPRAVFGFGTAIAFGLAVMVLTHRAPARVAERVEESVQVLAELGELDGPLAGDLEDEAILVDRLVLAKAQDAVADEAWIDDTMGLLNEVEETAVEASNGESLEELLRELESLDESEIASS